MFVCNKCRSNSIKMRTNSRFGKKTKPTAVWCKKCGSTDIGVVEVRDNRRRRSGPGMGHPSMGGGHQGPPRFGQNPKQAAPAAGKA